jgi:hypothetical protein
MAGSMVALKIWSPLVGAIYASRIGNSVALI